MAARVTRAWPDGEAIQVRVDGDAQPILFRWRGIPHPVQRIVETWQIHTNWWESSGVIRRTYHALLTQDGLLCVIYRDLDADTWHLARLYD